MKKLKIPARQSQRDSRWASVLLGYNTNPAYNIGNYGCLVTCFANYLGKTPIEINDTLKANQGFVNGGEFVWAKSTVLGLTEVYCSPRYDDAVSIQGLVKMKQLIDEGRPLIAEIDFNPTTIQEEMHFVLIHGYDETKEETFFAVDPWTGTEIDLSVYGGVRRTLYRFRAYDKILPFEDNYYLGIDLSNIESIKVCVQTWKDVVDGKFIKKEEYDKVVNELNELKKKQLNAEVLLTEKNTLALKLQECEKQRDIYKAEYDNATKEGGYIEQIRYLEEVKKKQADEISELTRQVNYWQTKYNSIKKSGLKFIQHAVILLCEKAGIDLSKI